MIAARHREWHAAAPTGRRELVTVGGVDVAIPEMLGKTEPDGKIEDDVGIGARFAGRRPHRGA